MGKVQARVSKQRKARKQSGKQVKREPTKAELKAAALDRLVSVAERAAGSVFDAKIALGREIIANREIGNTYKRQIAALRNSKRWEFVSREMSLTSEAALSKLATMAKELGKDAELQRMVGDLGLSNDDAHALASRMGRGLIRYSTIIRKLSGPGDDSEKKAWAQEVIASGKMPGTGRRSNKSTALKVSPEVKARVLKLAKANGVSPDELILDALELMEAELGE